MTAILGTEVALNWCFYHTTVIMEENTTELELVTVCKENEDIKLICGMVDKLAFLPLEDN